ncbi:FtsW/RodA/SpoVE family cell cycle protein, partial [Candidatus Pelagibacter sp.]|nr:FtsW/RodA/SpoVE family cell cycle protein [Candidatus Pelagibacter sp.]
MLISSVWLSLVFVSGINLYFLCVLLILSISIVGCMILYLPKFAYIKFRVTSFFDLASKGNYQSLKANDAIVDGGFFGKGIGEGTLNTRVPEAHTDYVISVIAEEFGVLLILLILLIFLLLIFRVFKKIPSEKNNCNKLILIGSILLIIFQVLIHIGVNIRLLPTTGMTLPFLSYGGS